MMNEASNACVPQEKPAILAAAEENAKMLEVVNCRLENILHRLRGGESDRPNEGCDPEPPTSSALRQLTKRQQRQLNRLLNSIDELDSLI